MIIVIIILFLIEVVIFCYWQNNSIVTTCIDYKNAKVPDSFNGFKITQISDLHDKRFGKNQEYLLYKIKQNLPDIIIITGDLVNRRKVDLDTTMKFVNEAVKIAPVYFTPGNHEAWINKYDELRIRLLNAGVNVLYDSKEKITRSGKTVEVVGLSDPIFITQNKYKKLYTPKSIKKLYTEKVDQRIKELSNSANFKIWLSHRPELFETYVKNNVDLVFCGHAHGGQIRLPLIGGIIAPNQGFFPKYTSGKHCDKNTAMIISRGLGKSAFPLRIFNRPEIVVATLEREE